MNQAQSSNQKVDSPSLNGVEDSSLSDPLSVGDDSMGLRSSMIAQQVTWKDLLYMDENNWALRHVSTFKRAEQEMQSGVLDGDAVSLACPQKFIIDNSNLPKCFERFGESTSSGISYVGLPIWLVSEEFHADLRHAFELSVKEFIKTSIQMDLRNFSSDHVSVAEAIEHIVSRGSSFIVGKFENADSPYELENYCKLGKCGKQKVSPEKLLELISIKDLIKEIILETGLSEDNLTLTLGRSSHELIAAACVNPIWEKLFESIRRHRGVSITEA
jgi:hypothetical protein